MLRGGWVVVDPALTTNAAKGAANQAAEALPGYGLVWGDQSINPRWQDWQDVMGGQESSLELEQAMNDPRFTILNVGVTDDLARAEAAVREVWGGPLCVYRLANTFDRGSATASSCRSSTTTAPSRPGSTRSTARAWSR